ncbi:uncharacterized protein (TIGR02453 family) [Mucilaginibacter gracilis]|uniref:Uncharacterized protein (TIGR02453 family) n=1 Tax=Mucilaginibacter gracilis TaxID=423350 RepID=A0A495J8Z8_9SPHI|nr:DUF2461 domain-containing protein [Mucilaginibacter gracilis]RKR84529.1 uncharacterized protein (TIGR02453 family) [Mucilaginibacter gracilis]
MISPVLPASSFNLMRQLKLNNNREWFAQNKEAYQKELALVEGFAHAMLQNLNTHDVIETPSGKKSLHRIYRDVRFSKDKTPFKANWTGGFRRATKYRRGGYYYHFEPGNNFLLAGFWSPNAQDLKLIRDDIAFSAEPLRNILNSPSFVKNFGTLQGETLKTSPKGYDVTHNAIDLLRYKQFLVIRRFTDEEVLSQPFFDTACQTFREMRPFLNYMSEVLSADVNGVSI